MLFNTLRYYKNKNKNKTKQNKTKQNKTKKKKKKKQVILKNNSNVSSPYLALYMYLKFQTIILVEKVYFRSLILECPSIGEYWNIFGVPVLPESVILMFFTTC